MGRPPWQAPPTWRRERGSSSSPRAGWAVCSGVKSSLDVPATLEHLETLGVPVVGFRTRRFPGFYLTDSGSTLDWDVKYEEEAAQLIASLRRLGPEGSGLIVA